MKLDPIVRPKPPTEKEDTVRLYVGGNYVEEGPVSKMHEAFDRECTAHSATVDLRTVGPQGERSVRKRASQR